MDDPVELHGTVRGVQNRTEVSGGMYGSAWSTNTLAFRLDPLSSGFSPAIVEMTAGRISGTVVDGDVVRVWGSYGPNGVFRAQRLVSEQTGVTIDVTPGKASRVLGVVFLLVFLAVVGFIAFAIYQVATDGGDSALERCLEDPAFTDEQCEFVHG